MNLNFTCFPHANGKALVVTYFFCNFWRKLHNSVFENWKVNLISQLMNLGLENAERTHEKINNLIHFNIFQVPFAVSSTSILVIQGTVWYWKGIVKYSKVQNFMYLPMHNTLHRCRLTVYTKCRKNIRNIIPLRHNLIGIR